MPIRIVQSKQNARLKELRRVLAEPGRNATGMVGIEGPNLLKESLRTGLRVRCIFAEEQLQSWFETLHLPTEIEVLIVPMGFLAPMLTTETPQPVAALIEPPDWTWAQVLPAKKPISPLILVLAQLQDPGNLGTIVRSAEAFGADAVIRLPGTVSEWNPKAVRASAGSVFRVPVVQAGATAAFDRLHAANVRILSTTMRAAEPATLENLAEPVALLIGNEGNGIPCDLEAKADGAVTVPCPGPVESLNAAVAASILLYEASRQRAERSGGLSRRGAR